MTTARILIADDSMVVRAVLKKQLATEGYVIAEAASGEAVLEECHRVPPDVVLLDVEMPGISGYQVLSTMQTEPTLAAIPVIFLSGRVSSDDVATGLRLGAHDYLRKPVETGELLARVTAALRTKRRHDELQRDVAHLREVAPVDHATGLLDPKALAERIRAWANGERGDDGLLAGILLVVEGLEAVDAAHGEDVAEEVFARVADAVQADLRGADVLGRCGPHELLALLPGTDHAAAEAVAKRLRTIANSTPVVVGKEVVTVTVAVGVATTADGDQESFVGDLQRALSADRASRTAPAERPTPPPPPPSDPRVTDVGRMPFEPPPPVGDVPPPPPPPAPPPPRMTPPPDAPPPPPGDHTAMEQPDGDDPALTKKGWRFFSSR